MSDVVTFVNSKKEFDQILADNHRVVVNFGALAWCVPCQRFEPHFERVAKETPQYKFLHVDVDKNGWAVEEYGVRGVPAVKLFEDGTFVRDVQAPQPGITLVHDLFIN